MEDSFGTILYIVITVVAIVISIIGKSKNKPKKPYIPPTDQYETPERRQASEREILTPTPKPVFQTIFETLSEEWKAEEEWEKTQSEVEIPESEIDTVPEQVNYEIYNKPIEADAELATTGDNLESIEYIGRKVDFKEDVLAYYDNYKQEPSYNEQLMEEIKSSLQSREEFRKAFVLTEVLNRPYS